MYSLSLKNLFPSKKEISPKQMQLNKISEKMNLITNILMNNTEKIKEQAFFKVGERVSLRTDLPSCTYHLRYGSWHCVPVGYWQEHSVVTAKVRKIDVDIHYLSEVVSWLESAKDREFHAKELKFIENLDISNEDHIIKELFKAKYIRIDYFLEFDKKELSYKWSISEQYLMKYNGNKIKDLRSKMTRRKNLQKELEKINSKIDVLRQDLHLK